MTPREKMLHVADRVGCGLGRAIKAKVAAVDEQQTIEEIRGPSPIGRRLLIDATRREIEAIAELKGIGKLSDENMRTMNDELKRLNGNHVALIPVAGEIFRYRLSDGRIATIMVEPKE